MDLKEFNRQYLISTTQWVLSEPLYGLSPGSFRILLRFLPSLVLIGLMTSDTVKERHLEPVICGLRGLRTYSVLGILQTVSERTPVGV